MERLYDVPRRLCLDSAVQIANILVRHQEKYHLRTIFATSVQHADAAATLLDKALSAPFAHKHPLESLAGLRHAFLTLTEFIRANAATYDAAAKMSAKFHSATRPPSPCMPLVRSNSAKLLPSPHELVEVADDDATRSGASAIRHLAPTLRESDIQQDGTNANLVPNWPNFGNIMYAHEIMSLASRPFASSESV
jgi:hypothetical protein